MPDCVVNQTYKRADLELLWPGLGPHIGAVKVGTQVGLFLLRKNEPGWANWFAGRSLIMEIRASASTENSWIKAPALEKCLYWSEGRGEYLCLGPVTFVGETPRKDGIGPLYTLQITDPVARVPRA